MIKTLSQLFALLCVLAVQGYSASIVSMTPSSGSGTSRTFVLQLNDASGASDIQYVVTAIGPWGAHSCATLTYPASNSVYLLSDDGTSWGTPATMGNGSGPVLQNSQCSIPMAQMYKTVSGNDLYLTFTATFSASFVGTQTSQASLLTNGNVSVGPVTLGSWTVPNNGSPLSITSFTPNNGTAAAGTFTVIGNDPNGATEVQYVIASIGTWDGAHGCMLILFGNGTVFLRSDDGSSWGGGGQIGSGTTLQNSQCAVPLSNLSEVRSGNSITFAYGATFSGTFAGTHSQQAQIVSNSNVVAGPLNFGNWTIPGGQVPPDQVIVTTRESVPAPAPSDPPSMSVSLSQSGFNSATGDIPTYIAGNSISYSIRAAKPFSQVWVRRIASQAANLPFSQTVCTHSTGQENEGLNDSINGACLLGTTDGNGTFIWNGNIYSGLGNLNYLEFTSAQFYVGPQTPDPAQPTTTRGPMNEDNYIGALTYFVQDVNGQPAKPFNE